MRLQEYAKIPNFYKNMRKEQTPTTTKTITEDMKILQ